MLLLNVQCKDDLSFVEESLGEKTSSTPVDLMKPTGDVEESAGNCLSFPVIWADLGTAKLLRGIENEFSVNGEWWYVWGDDPYDPQQPIYSCPPNPDNENLCLDGSTPGFGDGSPVYKAYVQKDPLNLWQATNTTLDLDFDTFVDRIDWGDNLESVDWNIRSQVRTEVVLYEDLAEPVTQYAMRHVDGWGASEVHGLQWNMQAGEPMYGVGTEATVYSHNARLTIQKLNVESLDELGTLTWVPKEGWSGDDVNPPIFNMAVYEADDGPGYYNAEINVKGKVIYGYTWNVKQMNEGVGYYRMTFSFDDDGASGATLNTFFDENTQIIVPIEEDVEKAVAEAEDEGGDTGGGTAVKDVDNNLTYIDVYIGLTRGAGGGKGGGKDNSPGDGSGGGKDDNFGRGGKGRNN